MPVELFWRLPLYGDGRSLSAQAWNRGDYSPERKSPHPYARTGNARDGYTYYDHLAQIARAAELTRFDGVWLPFTDNGEDPLIVAAALAREARRLRFVLSLRPPLSPPVYAAKLANSFQRLSGNRLSWHLTNEADGDKPWHGRTWSLREQAERANEFLDVAKGFWTSASFTYQGKHFEVLNGGFPPALQGSAFPKVYLSGTDDAVLEVSARHADVHVFPLENIEVTKDRVAKLRAAAHKQGRHIEVGVEADVVARHTRQDAWQDLERRWLRATQAATPISQSVRNAQAQEASASLARHQVDESLWTGFGHLRPGPMAGFVGSYDDVATQVQRYANVGVSTFILSSNPHLEEAYLVGERVLPRIRQLTEGADLTTKDAALALG